MKVLLSKGINHNNIMVQEIEGLHCNKEASSFNSGPNVQMAQGQWFTRRVGPEWFRHFQGHYVKWKAQGRRAPLRNEFDRADPVFHLGAWSTSDKCSQTVFHVCDVVLAYLCLLPHERMRIQAENVHMSILLYLRMIIYPSVSTVFH